MLHRFNNMWRRYREAVAEYFWDDSRAILAFLAFLSVLGAFLYLGGFFNRVEPYAWFAAGRLQVILRGPGDPEASFTRALGLKPAWGDVYYRRGLLWEKRNEMDRALADFQMAAEFLKASGKAYRAHGRVAASLGLEDQAFWDFKTAILKEPAQGRNYLERARLNMKLERYNEALADYKKASELDVELVDAAIGVKEAEYALEQLELRKKMTGE